MGDARRGGPEGESSGLMFPLFVPADRPERFAKARASGANSVILDLEDAVAIENKNAARDALVSGFPAADGVPVHVRINASGTSWHEGDIAAAIVCGAAGLVLPKAEDPGAIARLRANLPANMLLLGLVETARGIGAARDIAPLCDRLFFGSVDLASDLGCAHSRTALAHARSELVLAARMAAKPGPVDGVTLDIREAGRVQDDAAYGAELGFKGKLLIHPAQLGPAHAGYRPTSEELEWASAVVAEAGTGGAIAVSGSMVDAPVVARARDILQRASSLKDG